MLKETRVSKGLSQSELADRSGVSLRTIQGYEIGQRDINKASGETLYKLSKALGCSMEDLLHIE